MAERSHPMPNIRLETQVMNLKQPNLIQTSFSLKVSQKSLNPSVSKYFWPSLLNIQAHFCQLNKVNAPFNWLNFKIFNFTNPRFLIFGILEFLGY